MDSEVNQHKVAQDQNVQLTVIVKLINDVKLAHAEIHVCKPVLVVWTLSVGLLIDVNNAHAQQDILEIQPLNAHLKLAHVLEIHADRTQDAVMPMAVMNVLVHQDVLVIHTKVAYAVVNQ